MSARPRRPQCPRRGCSPPRRHEVGSAAVKILHVVPTYLPARRYGGPIFAVHGLCKALVARGNEVAVMTTNVDGDDVSSVPLDVPVEMDGVKVSYFASPLRRLYFSPSMRKALRRTIRDYD